MGLLRVAATIDVSQFWPDGSSDADTAKVQPTSFAYQARPGGAFQPTRAFEGAEVQGKVRKPVADKQGRITVRFQGIDAPELHYRPLAPGKPTAAQRKAFNAVAKEFRQHLGESGTVALATHLAKVGTPTIPCRVETAVSHPNEVFDTYGRLIGDILVTLGGKDVNLNHWLVEQGWAVPTFYDSMSNDEITAITRLAASAKQNKRGMFKHGALKLQLGALAFSLVYAQPGSVRNFTVLADDGPFIMPKLFRRQTAWATAQRAKVSTKETFHHFLSAGSPDVCYLTSNFLDRTDSATGHVLSEFVSDTGKIAKAPGDLVFHEASSKLFNAQGKRVVSW